MRARPFLDIMLPLLCLCKTLPGWCSKCGETLLPEAHQPLFRLREDLCVQSSSPLSEHDLLDLHPIIYLRDTLGQMSDPPLPGGAVVISANDSPLGARNIPKDGPLVTVKLPVQSGLTV